MLSSFLTVFSFVFALVAAPIALVASAMCAFFTTAKSAIHLVCYSLEVALDAALIAAIAFCSLWLLAGLARQGWLYYHKIPTVIIVLGGLLRAQQQSLDLVATDIVAREAVASTLHATKQDLRSKLRAENVPKRHACSSSLPSRSSVRAIRRHSPAIAMPGFWQRFRTGTTKELAQLRHETAYMAALIGLNKTILAKLTADEEVSRREIDDNATLLFDWRHCSWSLKRDVPSSSRCPPRPSGKQTLFRGSLVPSLPVFRRQRLPSLAEKTVPATPASVAPARLAPSATPVSSLALVPVTVPDSTVPDTTFAVTEAAPVIELSSEMEGVEIAVTEAAPVVELSLEMDGVEIAVTEAAPVVELSSEMEGVEMVRCRELSLQEFRMLQPQYATIQEAHDVYDHEREVSFDDASFDYDTLVVAPQPDVRDIRAGVSRLRLASPPPPPPPVVPAPVVVAPPVVVAAPAVPVPSVVVAAPVVAAPVVAAPVISVPTVPAPSVISAPSVSSLPPPPVAAAPVPDADMGGAAPLTVAAPPAIKPSGLAQQTPVSAKKKMTLDEYKSKKAASSSAQSAGTSAQPTVSSTKPAIVKPASPAAPAAKASTSAPKKSVNKDKATALFNFSAAPAQPEAAQRKTAVPKSRKALVPAGTPVPVAPVPAVLAIAPATAAPAEVDGSPSKKRSSNKDKEAAAFDVSAPAAPRPEDAERKIALPKSRKARLPVGASLPVVVPAPPAAPAPASPASLPKRSGAFVKKKQQAEAVLTPKSPAKSAKQHTAGSVYRALSDALDAALEFLLTQVDEDFGEDDAEDWKCTWDFVLMETLSDFWNDEDLSFDKKDPVSDAELREIVDNHFLSPPPWKGGDDEEVGPMEEGVKTVIMKVLKKKGLV